MGFQGIINACKGVFSNGCSGHYQWILEVHFQKGFKYIMNDCRGAFSNSSVMDYQ